jgi:hypothetical protein
MTSEIILALLSSALNQCQELGYDAYLDFDRPNNEHMLLRDKNNSPVGISIRLDDDGICVKEVVYDGRDGRAFLKLSKVQFDIADPSTDPTRIVEELVHDFVEACERKIPHMTKIGKQKHLEKTLPGQYLVRTLPPPPTLMQKRKLGETI